MHMHVKTVSLKCSAHFHRDVPGYAQCACLFQTCLFHAISGVISVETNPVLDGLAFGHAVKRKTHTCICYPSSS